MDSSIAQPRILKRTKRWLLSCLLFLVISCVTKQDAETTKNISSIQKEEALQKKRTSLKLIHQLKPVIQTGDMITRTGNDFTSYCFRQFCQTDKTYSHCGIASIENDSLFVYHSLGGEFNPDQKILREPFEKFVASYSNNGFAIFHADISPTETKRLMEVVQVNYDKGIPFDMEFDLETDDKLYCSEFAAKMYQKAKKNDSLFTPSVIGNFRFFAPDNLFSTSFFRQAGKAIY